MSRLGRPTGPKPSFTRDDVVTAALEAGVGDFTLSLVAQRLGVATSALYRTISSRDDLLRACLTRISSDSPFDSLSGGWQEVARDYADRMLLMLGRYPGLAGVLMTVPWAHQVFAPSIATILQALRAGGLDYHRALAVLDFVADTVIASCAQQEIIRSPVRTTGEEGGGSPDGGSGEDPGGGSGEAPGAPGSPGAGTSEPTGQRQAPEASGPAAEDSHGAPGTSPYGAPDAPASGWWGSTAQAPARGQDVQDGQGDSQVEYDTPPAPTGLEVARRSFESDAQAALLPAELVPSSAWLEQGWIRSKVEIIIAGVKALEDGAPGGGS